MQFEHCGPPGVHVPLNIGESMMIPERVVATAARVIAGPVMTAAGRKPEQEREHEMTSHG